MWVTDLLPKTTSLNPGLKTKGPIKDSLSELVFWLSVFSEDQGRGETN